MLKQRGHSSWMWLWLAVLALGIALVLWSCNPTQPVVITQRDSTHTERITTYRDTVIKVAGDRADLSIGTDVASLQRLVDELKRQVVAVRGDRQAMLRLSAEHDTLRITALCDELQVRLDSAIRHDSIMQYRVREYERFIQAKPVGEAQQMPGWAKGAALVAASIGALVLLFILLPLFKQLFKHGKA